MARTNKTLNFYVYKMDEGSYNLYNALTDKEIYFDVELNTVRSFLSLNEPTHPLITSVEEDLISFNLDPTDMSGMPDYVSKWDQTMYPNEKDYSVYDPYMTGGDSSYQMNFTFVNERDNNSQLNKDEEEMFDEEYDYLPEDK